MTVADIEQIFEEWAPRWSAWERDNVGLQVGDRSRGVSRVLVTLDVTEAIVREALAIKADLIISHHPLLFRQPKSITTADDVGRIVLRLAKESIALFSAHTNLDFTRGGVSFALAEALGLQNIRFLSPLSETLAKIAVFVPHDAVDRVMEAMAQAGAGTIGQYTFCSFRTKGNGTFRGSKDSKPSIGKAGRLETVDETRLEMILPRAHTAKVIHAMRAAHPYEEVAYDVFPLSNENPDFGMGASGQLPATQSLGTFLKRAKKALHADCLRYTGNLDQKVRRIAVCGGNGSDLLSTAIQADADAFVTADIRYHTFQSAADRIALIDAGHWETEQVILEPLARHLQQSAKVRKQKISVHIAEKSTNPVHGI